MLTRVKQVTLSALCGFSISLAAAQSTKPQIYVDPQGVRYSRAQYDSIRAANIGKPIAQISKTEKENETQITFEILTEDPNAALKQKWIGKPLPAFELKDVQGKKHTLTSLRGKLIVINFWSTTCAPCLQEMPLLSDLMSKYANHDVAFLALAPESVTQVKKIIAKRRFTYTVIPEAQTLFSSVGIESYPYHFIVNEAGVVRDIYSGSMVNAKTNESILDVRLVGAIDEAIKNRQK